MVSLSARSPPLSYRTGQSSATRAWRGRAGGCRFGGRQAIPRTTRRRDGDEFVSRH